MPGPEGKKNKRKSRHKRQNAGTFSRFPIFQFNRRIKSTFDDTQGSTAASEMVESDSDSESDSEDIVQDSKNKKRGAESGEWGWWATFDARDILIWDLQEARRRRRKRRH